jgi:uncharacterized protein (TIGR02996 family)
VTAGERALLNAILAAPDDDLPRLVYADWLDEHGRTERAEFIRIQCELATERREQFGTDVEVADRELELFNEFARPWCSILSAVPTLADFGRGFLNAVWITSHDLPQLLTGLTGIAPIKNAIFLLAATDSEAPADDTGSPIPILDAGSVNNDSSEQLAGATDIRVLCTREYPPDHALAGLAENNRPLQAGLTFNLTRCQLGESGARALAFSSVFGLLAKFLLASDGIDSGDDLLNALGQRYGNRLTVYEI